MSANTRTMQQNGRKYRSKKQRPCDLCRSRKTHCRIPSDESACELCNKLSRRCTFLKEPVRRTSNTAPIDGNDTTAGTGTAQRRFREASCIFTRQPSQDRVSDLTNLLIPGSRDGDHISLGEAPFWLSGVDVSQPTGLTPDAQCLPLDYTNMDLSSIGQVGNVPTFSVPREDSIGMILSRVDVGGDVSEDDIVLQRPSQVGSRPATITSTGSPESLRDVEMSIRSESNAAVEQSADTASMSSRPTSMARRSIDPSDWSEEYSLDQKKGYSNQLLGLSCESDPYLLRNYYYNALDTYPMFRLDFRKMQDDLSVQPFLPPPPNGARRPVADNAPVQFVMTHQDIWEDSLKSVERIQSGPHTEEADFDLLNKAVPVQMGRRLVKLYMNHVHPQLPILNLSDLSQMPYTQGDLLHPVGIQSAVYALASTFGFLDDQLSVLKGYVQLSTEDLWAIAHRSYQRASCWSHLSSLQLCLLLLQMPPPNFAVAEPLSTWALSCAALSIAENLGLNLDPCEWRLPRKEMMLRRRLWWFTYMQHTWHAVVLSRPSHLNHDNWSVSNLVASDFEGAELRDTDEREMVLRRVPLCLAECELALIAADILQEFYTLKSVRQAPSLTESLSRAQPLRTRIERWRQRLPLLSKAASSLGEEEFDDSAALRLSHLTLETLIFRALLRPLFYQALTVEEASREPVSVIFENCYTCARASMDFLCAMRAKHFASFWHPYVRFQLCYFSSFILLTLTQSPTMDYAKRARSLLSKWRDTLRTQSRAWPLARLATIRLDAAVWKGLSLVVHGAGPDSPAVILFREEEAAVAATSDNMDAQTIG